VSISIEVRQTRDVERALKRISEDIDEDLKRLVTASGLEMQSEIKRRINQGPATGRLRPGRGRSASSRASSEGEAPMTDTGRLVSSVLFRVIGRARVAVLSRIKYAKWLEEGTKEIAPRPVWIPVAEAEKPVFQRSVERLIQKAIKQ